MPRSARFLLLGLLLAGVHLGAAEAGAAAPAPAAPAHDTAAAPASAAEIDGLVREFNPDLYAVEAGDATRPVNRISNAFTSSGSNIAAAVTENTSFTLLVYAPFLILPQLLLLYVVFRFRERKDGRKAATFTHHTGLEIVWTVIPCLALVAVAIPLYQLMWKMELPPKDAADALKIEIIGKSFAWDYVYKDEKTADGKGQVAVGQDVAGIQEPVVVELGRPVILDVTSKDVNHAWWVPAFGVKKDAIIGRYTNTWFTPTRTGFFKGQCAELCGQGHGIMIITAVVADHDRFQRWLAASRHRDDAGKVWNAVAPGVKQVDQASLDGVVAGYLKNRHDQERQDALRYWVACNAASAARLPKAQLGMAAADWNTLAAERRRQVDAAIDRALAGK